MDVYNEILKNTPVKTIPSHILNSESILYHWCSYDDAIAILKELNIYGGKYSLDRGRHANFHPYYKMTTEEKFHNVLLEFKFKGEHKALFGDTFSTKSSPANSANTIFHILNEDIYDFSNLKLGHIKQSNVYPNTEGLIFIGIKWDVKPEDFYSKDFLENNEHFNWTTYALFDGIDIKRPPKKPNWIYRLVSRDKNNIYKQKIYAYNILKSLCLLEKDAKGKSFKVSPP
ncbi:hypothetical protein [Proteus terrae]|uniref:hypothetical protein n=1 Tax=Proteus terrae TaxID=1574161 RepID=UPI0032DB561A